MDVLESPVSVGRAWEGPLANVEVGDRAPVFELPDGLSYPWHLSGQLESGPVMLVFYRGDW
jgi:peroxiredoxin